MNAESFFLIFSHASVSEKQNIPSNDHKYIKYNSPGTNLRIRGKLFIPHIPGKVNADYRFIAADYIKSVYFSVAKGL